MIWNESKECMSRDQLEELQSKRLVKTVNRVYHNVEYYRKKMQELGLEPGDIKDIHDIEKLPFTTYEDLKITYPFGLSAVPTSELIRVHASSGTTGKPKIGVYTRRDIEIWSEAVARCLAMAGITRDDIIQVGYGYGLFTGGLGAHYGAEYLGAMVIPMSTGNTKKLIDMMIDCKATAIACTPSYLLHVAEDIEKYDVLDKIHLRTAICGAEPWTDEMRDQMEKRLNIKAYDIYGLTEICGPGVACDCEYHKGLHIWEDHFYPEIINPTTMKQEAEGVTGEMVITNLTKEGMPLLRYRTRDLTSLQYGKCECGRTMARIQRFKGRTDDMLIIRGVNVFPSQVEAALLTIDGTTPHYMLVVDRVDNKDTLEVQVEVAEKVFTDEVSGLEKLSEEIHQKLKGAIGLNAKVRLVEPNGLEHFDGKSKHVIDKRKLYE
ncbi:phenylacetate--CoA ligase family protein [Butyrivibrio sp. MC2013]|uniref:phenylacetate--CoA ligase family protein n=1 Tax=Butyrivibrio sp. MC2013 TaxID=1280686 RepID=UPI00041BDC65|nr:phenylacetate--CoA ligase [Butyrivibrio sp. MC2013]